MWGRILAAEAWNAASFFSKPENSYREEREKKKKKEKFWKSRLRKMTKLASFFFKSRMLMIIRHSEIKMMVKKSDSTQGTMSGCFGDS